MLSERFVMRAAGTLLLILLFAAIGIMLLSMGGCTSVRQIVAPPYVPNIVDVTNTDQAGKDAKACHQHALDRAARPKTTLADAGKVVNGAGQGFGNNLALASTGGWWGPGLGALGGAVATALQLAGVIYDDTPQTEQSCLLQKEEQHHDFTLAEPMLGTNHT